MCFCFFHVQTGRNRKNKKKRKISDSDSDYSDDEKKEQVSSPPPKKKTKKTKKQRKPTKTNKEKEEAKILAWFGNEPQLDLCIFPSSNNYSGKELELLRTLRESDAYRSGVYPTPVEPDDPVKQEAKVKTEIIKHFRQFTVRARDEPGAEVLTTMTDVKTTKQANGRNPEPTRRDMWNSNWKKYLDDHVDSRSECSVDMAYLLRNIQLGEDLFVFFFCFFFGFIFGFVEQV